jgi:hypothetical protein
MAMKILVSLRNFFLNILYIITIVSRGLSCRLSDAIFYSQLQTFELLPEVLNSTVKKSSPCALGLLYARQTVGTNIALLCECLRF